MITKIYKKLTPTSKEFVITKKVSTCVKTFHLIYKKTNYFNSKETFTSDSMANVPVIKVGGVLGESFAGARTASNKTLFDW